MMRLERAFKVGETGTYTISMKVGEAPATSIKVAYSVAAVEFQRATVQFSRVLAAQDTSAGFTQVQSDFDTRFASASMEPKTQNWPVILLCSASYLPGVSFLRAKEYVIHWPAADAGTRVEGTGGYVGFKTVGDVRCAELKSDYKVFFGDAEQATVHNTSRVSLSNGKLLSAEGTAETGGTTTSYTITADPDRG
jgi:hypothetical protein